VLVVANSSRGMTRNLRSATERFHVAGKRPEQQSRKVHSAAFR
jgi:hypothetical protein